jgi:hypothetical protein
MVLVDSNVTNGDRIWYLEWENNACKRIESRYSDYARTHHSGDLAFISMSKNKSDVQILRLIMRVQAPALFTLQQNSNIKITFNDSKIDYFPAFLPADLKQQLI